MKKNRNLIIGIVFVFGIALIYWGINYLKGLDIFTMSKTYYVEYPNVNGLLSASPVLISGYKVGQVQDISLKKDYSGYLEVKFNITEKIDIPENSIVRIESADLLGTRSIVIELGSSEKIAKPGHFFKGEIERSLREEVSMEMLPLKVKIESLLSSFDSVLVIVQYLFNEETREDIEKSFESIRQTVNNLERASSTIDTLLRAQQYRLSNIFANIESITLNIRNNNKQIANIIKNFSELSDTLLAANIKSTFYNLDKVMSDMQSITHKIKKGEGSMGLLLQDDSLYNNLQKASAELELLLEDMKNNPNRYLHFSVFGRKKK